MARPLTGAPYSASHSANQTLGLNPEQIAEMGQARLDGATYASLAAKYSVTVATATKHIKRWIAAQDLSKESLSLPVDIPSANLMLPLSPLPPPPQEEFDPCKTQYVNNPIKSDDKEQSYRENLLWACQAAGAKLRTGNRPNSCPNDKAFFLYQLACENPKDFMTKFSQVETKEKDDADDKAKKKSTQFLFEEIESQLEALEK